MNNKIYDSYVRSLNDSIHEIDEDYRRCASMYALEYVNTNSKDAKGLALAHSMASEAVRRTATVAREIIAYLWAKLEEEEKKNE